MVWRREGGGGEGCSGCRLNVEWRIRIGSGRGEGDWSVEGDDRKEAKLGRKGLRYFGAEEMANEWDQSSMGCKEGIDRIMERKRLEKSRYRADGVDEKRLLEGDDGKVAE